LSRSLLEAGMESVPRAVDPFASVLPLQLLEPAAEEEWQGDWDEFVGPPGEDAETSAGQDTGQHSKTQ